MGVAAAAISVPRRRSRSSRAAIST
ncbi:MULTISPECIES: hypothetical protein [Nonomuraea]|uniref:Uncharacterized protein n=1 Tax=Nonomuraea harbinensis TaxID=1286938 RepID=A0ABW1BNK1_9ACTN